MLNKNALNFMVHSLAVKLSKQKGISVKAQIQFEEIQIHTLYMTYCQAAYVVLYIHSPTISLDEPI